MTTFRLFGALAILCAGAAQAHPYSEPDAWHRMDIEGQTIHVAEYDGMAVIEGDIVLGPVSEVLSAPSRALFRRNLWPDGIVGYRISASMPTGNVNNIMSAIAHIESETSIVFEERETGDYVHFVPSSSTCSSFVGRQGGPQNLALAPACNRGNTVHEILHALGFHHEHQRPDRDEYVTIDLSQACPFTGSNFAIISPFLSDQLGPYDYTSIMHYFFNTFSCTGQPTIIGPPGQPLGSFFDMSEQDALAIEWLYFAPDLSGDNDDDDVSNADDLCLNVADAQQIDADLDGFGNRCDPDLNNDGVVNAIDLGLFRASFFTTDPVSDFDGDGVVNASDLGILKSLFFGEPGPSGRRPGRVGSVTASALYQDGNGGLAVDVNWAAPVGLPISYVVEIDSGGGFVPACTSESTTCTAESIASGTLSAAIRVRAVGPYGDESVNSLTVTATP